MKQPRFKYRREDFGPLPVTLHHLTLTIRFFEDRVEAENILEMTAREPLRELQLDANDLDLETVIWCLDDGGDAPRPDFELRYDYRRERNQLVVELPRVLGTGERFALLTRNRCFPSDHLLEGIYRDTTPPGAPQQYMSQCQQWGFQRIMPIFDDCRAKCTMTTTLEGDARYTHLISNGNVDRRRNPDGRPRPKPGDPSRQIITYHNPIPMAPYLFIACAGTWDALTDSVTTPNGRSVQLEYLVPPGHLAGARLPMEILKDSVRWIERTQGYQYTGDVYRTICMNKSNFGGMENVGNTTIVTDAALIGEHSLDQQLLYAHAVIVHEFEHNQCGSETTMDTPFDVWLNEAYTVDVERQYMSARFDPTFIRLHQLDSIRNPLLGPLAIEDGGHAGRIVRDGFNDPDELIDGVTYVKAAEVIRMLRLVLGRDQFVAGKELYFRRYRGGNATTDQFFECFEEISGTSLESFKREWLYRVGYPSVTAETRYDPASRRLVVDFRQHCQGRPSSFHLPIELALVDADGKDLPGSARVFQLTAAEGSCEFSGITEPPRFVSINRGGSFYGSFHHRNATIEQQIAQARLDPDAVNRIEAFRQLSDRERIALLTASAAAVSEPWLELYGDFIHDPLLSPGLRGFFLRIEEQPLDRAYCTWYPELVAARERLMAIVNQRYRDALLELLASVNNRVPDATLAAGIEARFLKAILLQLITVDDTAASHEFLIHQYRTATNANDRFAALVALNRSSAPLRREILEQVFRLWHREPSGYANYLKIVGSGSQDDFFTMIAEERRRPQFDLNHPTLCRSLLVTAAANTKMIWTAAGISWVGAAVIELAPVNGTTAGRLLNTFQHVARLKPDLRRRVTAVLETIAAEVNSAASPTIAGQVRSYLEAARAAEAAADQ